MSKNKRTPVLAAALRTVGHGASLATDMRVGGNGSRFIGGNGEINAGSRKDLAMQIASLIQTAGTQELVTESEALRRQEKAALMQNLLTASFSDSTVHRELGEIMADDLYIAQDRDGFARRFLVKQSLTQGQIPRVKMRGKNVQAVICSAPVKVATQITNDLQFFAPEFEIIARPFVTKREIDQSITDVVDEKYVEGQEALMVTEDRTWKAAADQTINIDNPLSIIAGTLTSRAVMAVRQNVANFNLTPRFMLLATDLWTDIATDSSWYNVIDPVSQHELLLTGKLGTVYGMDLISDAFRHPAHKVLNQGEFYIVSDPLNHGAMSDRGGVDSEPTTISVEGTPGRGWVLTETISMVIANTRSVSVGKRL